MVRTIEVRSKENLLKLRKKGVKAQHKSQNLTFSNSYIRFGKKKVLFCYDMKKKNITNSEIIKSQKHRFTIP